MWPVLQALGNESPLSLADLYSTVATAVGLDEAELREIIPSGQPRYKNRIGWAAVYLNKARAIDRPRRGTYAIADRGRQLLNEGEPVTETRLSEYPEYREFMEKSKQGAERRVTVPGSDETSGGASPQEAIASAAKELRSVLEADLLEKLLALDPYAFERLVLKVLGAMGYGKDGSLESTSKSGDGGIDGIISQDPLGLDRIYLQAKRFAGSPVGSKDVQAFMGVLSMSHGDRGVFITTSTFTESARQAAEKSRSRIELIDGQQLVSLMLNHEVGVQPESVTTIYKIDDDFFEDL
jgi:restriction system protein